MSLKITKSGNADIEKAKMAKGFPLHLQKEVGIVLENLSFDHGVETTDEQIYNIENLIHLYDQTVSLGGELLNISYRIYFHELPPEKEKQLTSIQLNILHCIYLKHHNGFVRQKCLEQLLHTEEYFVIPYTIQLLGEYVIEILYVLDQHVNKNTIHNYVKFINENKKYWQKTESRVISYWNAYYRQIPLKDYIGKQIVDRINSCAQQKK